MFLSNKNVSCSTRSTDIFSIFKGNVLAKHVITMTFSFYTSMMEDLNGFFWATSANIVMVDFFAYL